MLWGCELLLELATDFTSSPALDRLSTYEAARPLLWLPRLALLRTEPAFDLRSSRIASFFSLSSASFEIFVSSPLKLSSVRRPFFKKRATSLSMYFESYGLSPYLSLNLFTSIPFNYSLFWMSIRRWRRSWLIPDFAEPYRLPASAILSIGFKA